MEPTSTTRVSSGPGTSRLSKSKYLAGLQCLKRLFLEVRAPELATPPDEHTQAILDMGTAVGELARRRFPGGVLVTADHRHAAEALQRTAELVADPAVPAVFEAAVVWDRILVRVDILVRMPEGWHLIEVKSSTRVKDIHLDDLAIQAQVLRGAGLRVVRVGLLHLNTRYVYAGGEPDPAGLFALENLTDAVATREAVVPERLIPMRETLQADQAPRIAPSGHCHVPYECPFWNHCTSAMSPRWIYYLPGGEGATRQLAAQGITTIDEIPASVRLSPVQRRMKDNKEWIGPGLGAALAAVRYPVAHLDFETFMPAIPRFPGTRPYQTIPTQWSLHVEDDDATVSHHEYLCQDVKDPREELAVLLLEALGRDGTICVYSGYERYILEELAERCPSLRQELRSAVTRLWDLQPVIREHYYHPGFQGSYSIKAVLPAVVPALDYADLEIREGGVAALQYQRLMFGETDLMEKVRIREALLRYCARDTRAMLELRRVLKDKAVKGRDA